MNICSSFLLFVTAVAGIQESSRFEVLSPKEIVDKFAPNGVVQGTPAMFGDFPFTHQQNIQGVLYYADPPDDELGCSDFSDEDKAKWPKGFDLVVMVDRGNCTFVKKVKHLQNAGAIAAIIVDNKDEALTPYMADDHSGASISIPSLLIHKNDGLKFKKELAKLSASSSSIQQTKNVLVKFSWNLPHPDNRVEWDLWTSSNSATSDAFKAKFGPVAAALGDSTLMEPHYYFHDGNVFCYNANASLQSCGSRCTNQGRYCHYDPDQNLDQGLSGTNIVRENLRQRCMWLHLNKTDQHLKWWDYVAAFKAHCSDEAWSQKCSLNEMDAVNIIGGRQAVLDCIQTSGGYGDQDSANTIMDSEIDLKVDMNIFSWPTVLINNRPYRQSLNCPTKQPIFRPNDCNLLEALCTGFKDQPRACLTSNCRLGIYKDDCGVCGGPCVNCSVDACGYCMANNSPDRNLTCQDCSGEAVAPGQTKKVVRCGVCGGPGRDACGDCTTGADRVENPDLCNRGTRTVIKDDEGEGFPPWGVALIVLGCVGLVGGGVFVYMRRREDAMRQDIDSLLKQYLPMGADDAQALT